MYDLSSDTNIYKNTYHQLVIWVKELLRRNSELCEEMNSNKFVVERSRSAEDLNYRQAGIIMLLEHRVRMMAKDYGIATSNVVSNDELMELRLKRKGGGGNPPEGDWLSGMKSGTEFLVSPKMLQTNWVMTKFMQAGLHPNGFVLIIPMQGEEPSSDPKEWVWAHPERFCKFWEFMGVLLIPKEEDE